MRLLLLLALAGCAHIPGTDVTIPPEWHEGYRLAICAPIDHRNEACCVYRRGRSERIVCTEDYGDVWTVIEPGEAEPPPLAPGHESL